MGRTKPVGVDKARATAHHTAQDPAPHAVAVLQIDTREYPLPSACIRTWPGGCTHADMLHRYTQENPKRGKEYRAITPLMNAWQCKQVGWTFKYHTAPCPEGRHPSWVKIGFVLQHWDSLDDTIMILDTDAWIRDAEGLSHAIHTRLTGKTLFLAAEEPKCSETSSLGSDIMNGGFATFKKDAKVKAFLQHVWTLGDSEWATGWPWEQACMCKAHRDNVLDCQAWIDILPLTTANTPAGTLVSHCWYKDHTFDVALGDFLSVLAAPLLGISPPTLEIVVARCGEDVGWLERWTPYVDRITVYDKSQTPLESPHPKITVKSLPNVGREAHSYLSHFVGFYDTLCDIVVCTQGRYDDHLSESQFHEMVRSPTGDHPPTTKGLDVPWGKSVMQHHGWTPGKAWGDQPMQPAGMSMGKFFLTFVAPDLLPESEVEWWYGAIFRTTKQNIRRHPVEKYEAMLAPLEIGSNPEVAHMLERSWPSLLNHSR